MGAKADFVRKKYGPLARKTLTSALWSCLAEDFPPLRGERRLRASAERIRELIFGPVRSREALRHGPVLWLGIATEERPGWRKPLSQMELVALLLELVTDEHIEAILKREKAGARLPRRCPRLCRQAHKQGGLLSNCDLAVLPGCSDSALAPVLADYERNNNCLVPRRATLHDVGSGLTHQRVICWKRYGEGKRSEQVARESCHGMEAVDRYLGQFERVRHGRRQEFSEEETAYVPGGSRALVAEYRALDEQLRGAEGKQKPDEKKETK